MCVVCRYTCTENTPIHKIKYIFKRGKEKKIPPHPPWRVSFVSFSCSSSFFNFSDLHCGALYRRPCTVFNDNLFKVQYWKGKGKRKRAKGCIRCFLITVTSKMQLKGREVCLGSQFQPWWEGMTSGPWDSWSHCICHQEVEFSAWLLLFIQSRATPPKMMLHTFQDHVPPQLNVSRNTLRGTSRGALPWWLGWLKIKHCKCLAALRGRCFLLRVVT